MRLLHRESRGRSSCIDDATVRRQLEAEEDRDRGEEQEHLPGSGEVQHDAEDGGAGGDDGHRPVQIIYQEGEDILCWKHTPDGNCSSKSAYKEMASFVAYLITNNMGHANLEGILILMWQIWKARNEWKFQNLQKEPTSIFFAASAMQKTYSAITSHQGNNEDFHEEDSQDDGTPCHKESDEMLR
uniref:Uncharacterized protein n=1 Tax=Oryza brachyantha TaxID=4533 RepID=J3MER8_ORYBR